MTHYHLKCPAQFVLNRDEEALSVTTSNSNCNSTIQFLQILIIVEIEEHN